MQRSPWSWPPVGAAYFRCEAVRCRQCKQLSIPSMLAFAEGIAFDNY
ncbi:hypothetical protein QF001_000387 [Paraburkholderia youngii]